jgi:hypothetical protein
MPAGCIHCNSARRHKPEGGIPVTNRCEPLQPYATFKTLKKIKQFVTNEVFVELQSVISIPATPQRDLKYFVTSLSHPPFI